MSNDWQKIEILLIRLLENELTDAEFETLKEWMAGDEKAVSRYCEFIKHYSVVQNAIKGELLDSCKSGEGLDVTILERMLDTEELAPEVEISDPESQVEVVKEVEIPGPVSHKSSKLYFIYSLIVSTAAVFLLMFIVYATIFPPKRGEDVAKISDQLNVQWCRNGEKLLTNDRLLTNQPPYRIESGLIKIEFDRGVEVLVEGPASFSLPSDNEFEILNGKAYAKVPKKATGFTMLSPNSKVIDLGTEFGISVDNFGESDIHLVKGKANLIAGFRDQNKESMMLEVGKSKRVDLNAQVNDIKFDENLFAREMYSEVNFVWRGEGSVDVVELLKGRFGFNKSDHSYFAINHSTGQCFIENQIFDYNTDNKFHPVEYSPFVDGVFVPDSSNSYQVISTSNIVFENCPMTNSEWWYPILTKPVEYVKIRQKVVYRLNGLDWKIDGKLYGDDESAFVLHANSGITLDLSKVRDAIPGVSVHSFTADLGVVEADGEDSKRNMTDFWILIDGKLKQHVTRKQVLVHSDYVFIDFDVEDRFLTFIATDGGDDITCDWWVIGNPKLNIGN